VPLGTWIHLVFTDEKDWRVERAIYRLVGVDARSEQRWTGYAVSAVSFAVASVVALFLLITERAALGFIGQDRVNVTELNIALVTSDAAADRQ
jgi:K+-transporting ATPase ATPase A chain